MTAATPAPGSALAPRPACVRCGEFDPDGPAADLGIPICAGCWAWRPIEARARRPGAVGRAFTNFLSFATLGAIAVAIALRSLPPHTHGRPLSMLQWALLAVAGSYIAGLVMLGAMAIAEEVRGMSDLVATLGVDLTRLERASGAIFALPVWVWAGGWRWAPAFLLATRRGLLLLGATVRATVPATEAELGPAWLGFCIRLASRNARGGPGFVFFPRDGGFRQRRAVRALLSKLEAARAGAPA